MTPEEGASKAPEQYAAKTEAAVTALSEPPVGPVGAAAGTMIGSYRTPDSVAVAGMPAPHDPRPSPN